MQKYTPPPKKVGIWLDKLARKARAPYLNCYGSYDHFEWGVGWGGAFKPPRGGFKHGGLKWG